jgi:16S rRNA (guanine527-N7)-methyltransferase
MDRHSCPNDRCSLCRRSHNRFSGTTSDTRGLGESPNRDLELAGASNSWPWDDLQMTSLANARVGKALEPYGVVPSTELVERIKTYIGLLLKWNRSISLTTITDVEEILRFHFGESLFALSMLPVEKSRLADVGSGAGFPGIPLAMARPSLEVTLIESNAKKFAFLNEVIRTLQLDNALPFRGRMTDFHHSKERLDVVTARALGQFDELVEWSRRQLSPSGRLVLWVGDEDCRKIAADHRFTWGVPERIPGSDRRFVLLGFSQADI